MFSLWLDYPEYNDELTVVKNTTSAFETSLKPVITKDEIIEFQNIIRKIPVNDNVLKYAVTLASKTRPGTKLAPAVTNNFLKWGAGPRASQYLILGAKTHAALNGRYSPDIENVNAVALPILRHRIIKNYKAEAENISVDEIINQLMKS